MFERWVFPSVFIDFTNEISDSTDKVPGYKGFLSGKCITYIFNNYNCITLGHLDLILVIKLLN